jgi:perosamine synthetase
MISVCEPLFDGNEKKYVQDCLDTNWISSLGQYITRFEDEFSHYCGVSNGVACANGTVALHLSLVALGIGHGDEVIIPDFTLIVSANVVILAGAKPVLVDVDPKTWCIDAEKIEEKITPRTKAIMVVHMYGHPCDMAAITRIARKHNLYVVEDCAQAHGAEVNGKKVGSWGDVGCFSFYGNKILTTGEGGMVVCQKEAIADRLRLLRNQGFEEPRFVHRAMGYNYRLTNLQAAIGLAQTERVCEKVARKRDIAQAYTKLLEGEPSMTLPWEAPWAKNVYWMYGIVIGEGFGPSRDNVMEELRRQGVETRPFFYPMHRQPVYQGADARFPDTSGQYPVTDSLASRGLYLPSGLGLTSVQIEEVVEKLLHCKK